MTVDQLRARWKEVFGEETRQRHRQHLIKRLARQLPGQPLDQVLPVPLPGLLAEDLLPAGAQLVDGHASGARPRGRRRRPSLVLAGLSSLKNTGPLTM